MLVLLRSVIFSLVFLMLPVFADDMDDWDIVIEDPEVVSVSQLKNKSFSNYWDEHFYGDLGGAFSVGDNHYRHMGEFKLGFSERWDFYK